jgi:putative membrane protein
MTRIKAWALACVVGLLLAGGLGGMGWSADAPMTGAVLGKLHHANLKEISMGKLAQKSGQSKEVKAFGQALVKDHTAADQKVVALAKQEKLNLETQTPPMTDADMPAMPAGADFDAKFARMMLEDHEHSISDASAARDATNDDKLRKLLDELLPVLWRHREAAQHIVDATSTRASL